MDKWDACNFHVNEDDLEGRVCYGGLDLSSTTDITAFVLVFPPMDRMISLPFYHISGFRKIPWNFESEETMFHMISGRGKGFYRLQKEM